MEYPKFSFKIDTKSLFYNLKNDFASGHTATVSSPLRQGNHERPEYRLLANLDSQINPLTNPDLVFECTKSSKSIVKILNILLFSDIYVNGEKIETNGAKFAMYIKIETDKERVQYGRIKLHYPLSLKNPSHEINNKQVICQISAHLKNYAFYVRAFEFYGDGKINFVASILGQKDIPLSKVFVDHKGTGNQFNPVFSTLILNYDLEIPALKNNLRYQNITTDEYINLYESFEKKALCFAVDYLKEKPEVSDILILSELFPYCPYNIEYLENGIKQFLIVKFTATNTDYFSLPTDISTFLYDFKSNTKLLLIRRIADNSIDNFSIYSFSDINKFRQKYEVIGFYK